MYSPCPPKDARPEIYSFHDKLRDAWRCGASGPSPLSNQQPLLFQAHNQSCPNRPEQTAGENTRSESVFSCFRFLGLCWFFSLRLFEPCLCNGKISRQHCTPIQC